MALMITTVIDTNYICTCLFYDLQQPKKKIPLPQLIHVKLTTHHDKRDSRAMQIQAKKQNSTKTIINSCSSFTILVYAVREEYVCTVVISFAAKSGLQYYSRSTFIDVCGARKIYRTNPRTFSRLMTINVMLNLFYTMNALTPISPILV